jgi:hypothetical protein
LGIDDETLPRTELLKARGYPDEIVHTNGSTPEGTSTVSEPDERECGVCHGRIPPDRPINSPTCSGECATEWRLAQRRRRHHETREAPADVVELLTRSGLELVSVEVVLGGERWVLSRQG